jgi:hypothetical protein
MPVALPGTRLREPPASRCRGALNLHPERTFWTAVGLFDGAEVTDLVRSVCCRRKTVVWRPPEISRQAREREFECQGRSVEVITM